MNTPATTPESDLIQSLKRLMVFRVLFTSLLLGSTIILQLEASGSYLEANLVVIYGLTGGIFLLSSIYFALINRIHRADRQQRFAYIQISLDTVIISLIIFVTGSYSSIFSFLYPVVIIYSSILFFRPGTLVIAALCSIQYGLMIDLEYYGVLVPFVSEINFSAAFYPWSQVLYKILITMVACFAVAFLSSLLSERERKAKKELIAMEDKVRRVEKLAAVGEMAAGLAHEIRNPLASLSGSIQLLGEDMSSNPDDERLMQIVLRETERLSGLVTNFLLFARPPAGSDETIRLDNALAEIVSLFEKDHSTSSRVTIETAYEPDVWVRMDPGHLRQICWNLLVNAAEAIEGAGRIGVNMHAGEGHQICIDISDTGCGMSRELIQTVFNPFFTTKPGGTGLGLSIVHSILESYDGTLDVDSHVSRGTTFSLKLRRVAASGGG